MHVTIDKEKRMLILINGTRELLTAPIALGRCPAGKKQQEGDGKTPEGRYTVCLIKENGKYGRSIGISYPGIDDAKAALDAGLIAAEEFRAIEQAVKRGERPPWGTALGGEIYIHEGGTEKDWTQGCIALKTRDMDMLFPYCREIEYIDILP